MNEEKDIRTKVIDILIKTSDSISTRVVCTNDFNVNNLMISFAYKNGVVINTTDRETFIFTSKPESEAYKNTFLLSEVKYGEKSNINNIIPMLEKIAKQLKN